MSEEIIELMVDAGKAAATPAIAQKLGPLKINIAEVMGNVNEKTSVFKGMKVPVKVKIDTESKDVDITIGTPPTAELIKQELGLKKGSGSPNLDKVANIAIEQVIKIAKMKEESMIVNDLHAGVKTVMGSCNALGILVEGKGSNEIDLAEFKTELDDESTEVSADKQAKLKHQLEAVKEELAAELAKQKQQEEEEAAELAEEAEAKDDAETPEEGEEPKEGEEAKPEGAADEGKKEEQEPKEEQK